MYIRYTVKHFLSMIAIWYDSVCMLCCDRALLLLSRSLSLARRMYAAMKLLRTSHTLRVSTI